MLMSPTPYLFAPESLERLDKLRRFDGAPTQFWQEFLHNVRSLTGSSDVIIIIRSRSVDELAPWKEAFANPVNSPVFQELRAHRGELERLALQAEGSGCARLEN